MMNDATWLMCVFGSLAVATTAIARVPPASPVSGFSPRRVVSLDGTWQVEQGSRDAIPKEFTHTVVVPGLMDMAHPAFDEVGKKSKRREAFWYRRTFTLDGPTPPVAILNIRKAMWGTRVFLNGQMIGEHVSCFTPTLMDVTRRLKGDGQTNELIICVGADRESLPEGVPSGWDTEKMLYVPGIYDSVELTLTGTPYVANIQTAPDVPNRLVRVVAEIQAGAEPCQTTAAFQVCEAASGKVVGEAKTAVRLAAGESKKVDVTIPMPDCRLWSPEDPFLYAVGVGTSGDALKTRFGMRSFQCDPKTKRMVLNGRPYYLRGTNVTAFRFFEDADRGDLPWRASWVRKLHQKFKTMHWNSIRYSIGFPPDFWYDIADEEGFLIQDEFPIWLEGRAAPEHPKAEHLIPQYTEWMRTRWNHPCVVIWDAQNESFTDETAKAIAAVRHLDLSDRPWENGYGGAPKPTDCMESHPYFFNRWWNPGGGKFYLRDIPGMPLEPWLTDEQKRTPAATLVNEYCWLWLTRDGDPTTLTKPVYDGILGPNSTVHERRLFHARGVAALTEFWRCHRQVAGVMHFCELGYSRPGDKPRPEGGATCDDFVDIENLVFEPLFAEYVGEAFHPVGLMIDAWADTYSPGRHEFPVVVINDLRESWSGDIRFRVLGNGTTVAEKTSRCDVDALGSRKLTFAVDLPDEAGSYQLEAALIQPGESPVRSLRDFVVPATKAGSEIEKSETDR